MHLARTEEITGSFKFAVGACAYLVGAAALALAARLTPPEPVRLAPVIDDGNANTVRRHRPSPLENFSQYMPGSSNATVMSRGRVNATVNLPPPER